MLVTVEVKPNRAKESIEALGNNHFRVALAVPPIEGKANKALQKVLATYFKVAPSCVILEKGVASRRKTVRIV